MGVASIPEYSDSIRVPNLILPQLLSGGKPTEENGRLIKYSGGFCVVFPYLTANQKFAVRCWHANVSGIQEKAKIISEVLQKSNLPYFVRFEYFSDGIITPQGVQAIVIMDWVEALPLKKFISKNLNNKEKLLQLASNFETMVKELHKNKIAHGDLQHGNILVKDDTSIILVDYDSMFVPGLEGYSDDIKGLVGYQHKSRWGNKYLNEKIDYFSELIIYLSIKALALDSSLWNDLKIEDSETLLFSKEDLEDIENSYIFYRLESHPELRHILSGLLEFLSKDNINDLNPLEQVLIPPEIRISEKWKEGNGYVSKPISLPNIESKWNNNTYNKEKIQQEKHNEIIESISKKF